MGIVIVPIHLPGHCNIQADSLSRPGETLPTEWEIHPDLLWPVFNRWDGHGLICLPHSITRNVIRSYLLFQTHGRPISTHCGSRRTRWAFPPFKIIPTVIAKLRQYVSHNSSVQSESVTHSCIQNGCIMDAEATITIKGKPNSHSRWPETTHSSRSSNRCRSRDPY